MCKTRCDFVTYFYRHKKAGSKHQISSNEMEFGVLFLAGLICRLKGKIHISKIVPFYTPVKHHLFGISSLSLRPHRLYFLSFQLTSSDGVTNAILLKDNMPPIHRSTRFTPNALVKFGALVYWWQKNSSSGNTSSI